MNVILSLVITAWASQLTTFKVRDDKRCKKFFSFVITNTFIIWSSEVWRSMKALVNCPLDNPLSESVLNDYIWTQREICNYFVVRLMKLLNKRLSYWWFEKQWYLWFGLRGAWCLSVSRFIPLDKINTVNLSFSQYSGAISANWRLLASSGARQGEP